MIADDRGSGGDRARGRRRSHYGRIHRQGLSGSALRRGEAELHPQAAEGRPARSSSAASSRSAGCRRSFSRAATRKIQPGAGGLSGRVASGADSRDPDGQITRAMGDVHPLGNPHYWLDPENGKRIAKEIADKLSAVAAERPRVLRSSGSTDFTSRLDAAEKRWLAHDGALQGHEDRHLPSVVSEFRRAFRPRHRRLCRAAAGHSADAAAHARSHQRDEAAERQAGAGRALLRPEDAERDRARDRARRCS